MYPDAPIVKRNGEVDAWDNTAFREAVKATGKSQVILAGITTDVSFATAIATATHHGLTLCARSARHSLPSL
jgi:nicotinamidase-related amidase